MLAPGHGAEVDGVSALGRVPTRSNHLSSVVPALVAGIHVFLAARVSKQSVDGRDKPGHDGE